MNIHYFLFLNGKITEVDSVDRTEGQRLYFHKVPRNFLELSDELKKLSFLSDAVYVALDDAGMTIFLHERESLDLFTKLVLSNEEMTLPVNERLKEFLLEHGKA